MVVARLPETINGSYPLGTNCSPCGISVIGSGTVTYLSPGARLSTTHTGDGMSWANTSVAGASYTTTLGISGVTGTSYSVQVLDGTSLAVLTGTTVAQAGNVPLVYTAASNSTLFKVTAISATSGTLTCTTAVFSYTIIVQGTVATNICNKNSDAYRYGYNSKLKDNEYAGIGNSYDFGDRGLNSQIGRFKSRDKKENEFPSASPYSYARNSPIMSTDKEGKNAEITITRGASANDVTVRVKVMNYQTAANQAQINGNDKWNADFYDQGGTDLRKTWNNSAGFKGAVGKTQYQAYFDVTFHTLPNDNALNQKMHDDPAANKFNFNLKDPSSDNGQNETHTDNGNDMTWNVREHTTYPESLPHEISHELGFFGDRANKNPSISNYENRKFSQNDVNDFVTPAIELANQYAPKADKVIIRVSSFTDANGKPSDSYNTYKAYDDKGNLLGSSTVPTFNQPDNNSNTNK